MATPRKTTTTRKPRQSSSKAENAGKGKGFVPYALGAVAVVAGGALVALSRYLSRPGNAEHSAPDLALDKPHNDGSQRAPEAFRPDPTAPVPESERDGLRPAIGPAPTLVRGSTVGG